MISEIRLYRKPNDEWYAPSWLDLCLKSSQEELDVAIMI